MKTNKVTKGLTVLFFTVSILDIIGVALDNSLLQVIFKPMIMLSLIALYFYSVEKKNNGYILALAFSFLGDVLLMDKSNLFLYGIAAFLMTQIIYIKLIIDQLGKTTLQQKIIAIFPFAIFIIVLLNVLKSNLNEFLIPVNIYGLTISIFGIVSLLNYISDRSQTSLILLVGAILFILSDSMIALHKFHEPKSIYPIATMITYVLAQYLIYWFISNTVKISKKKN
ncbi:MAG: lysoplasmalogenase [Bacteroidota bacterium]